MIDIKHYQESSDRCVTDSKSDKGPLFDWTQILVCVGAPALGVGLGILLLLTLILPKMGYAGGHRPMALGLSLTESSLSEVPTAVFLGSSIVVEGIDAELVEAAAPGWNAYNLAINGCEINEQRLMLPRILAAGPRAVVFHLRPLTVAMPGDVPADKAYGYVLGGFPSNWPEDFTMPSELPFVSAETLARLKSTSLEARLHFRRVPILMLNEIIRLRLRGGLRAVLPGETVRPFNMTTQISGDTLDHHVGVILEENRTRLNSVPEPWGRELELAIRDVAESGAIPVLIMAPQHPRVSGEIEDWTKKLEVWARARAREHGGVYLGAEDLVPADGFADALHLGEAGRTALSTRVGSVLQQQIGAH